MIRLPRSKATKRKSADIDVESEESSSDVDFSEPPKKTPALCRSSSHFDSTGSSSSSSRLKYYKSNLSYDPRWKTKYPWMDYSSGGMICTVCKVHGNVPIQANGAWVTRPVHNWVKATALLAKHDQSDWHKEATKKQALSLTTQKHGDVMDQIKSASEEQRQQNRLLIKKLVRSLYFLVKHHIPHTTMFEGLITLQIENGDVKLKNHREHCPRNATYESYATVTDLLGSISAVLESNLLSSLSTSTYFSLMADESTDISSKEELSICARWLHKKNPVEHFLGIMPAKETTAKAIAGYLHTFLESKSIDITKMRGLGFDGTNTMSGQRSGVQLRLRLHSPSAIYVHCRCHQLQLASVNAAKEHVEVKRVIGTLLTIWKAFHYSPKKAEKLTEIQAELNSPELKMLKPSDTRWLARERAVRAVRRSLPALVATFEEIYEETGDAEAHGIATLLTKYNTVACIYMLSDILHTVAKLQGTLQGKEIDLASVPGMVQVTTERLKELKDKVDSSTWFKDHYSVFTNPSQLGARNIEITESIRYIVRTYKV